jgi:hypothetical protein
MFIWYLVLFRQERKKIFSWLIFIIKYMPCYTSQPDQSSESAVPCSFSWGALLVSWAFQPPTQHFLRTTHLLHTRLCGAQCVVERLLRDFQAIFANYRPHSKAFLLASEVFAHLERLCYKHCIFTRSHLPS